MQFHIYISESICATKPSRPILQEIVVYVIRQAINYLISAARKIRGNTTAVK